MAKYLPIELSVRCIKLWRTITKALAAVGLAALFWAPYHSALAQEEAAIEAGREQFSQKCAVCHGLEAKGDGKLAQHLKEPPSNLSLLSKENGGTFPFWETYGKIDGRDIEIVRTHGTAFGELMSGSKGAADDWRCARFWRLSSSYSPFRENNVIGANCLSGINGRMTAVRRE
jgi:hypothetical protein